MIDDKEIQKTVDNLWFKCNEICEYLDQISNVLKREPRFNWEQEIQALMVQGLLREVTKLSWEFERNENWSIVKAAISKKSTSTAKRRHTPRSLN